MRSFPFRVGRVLSVGGVIGATVMSSLLVGPSTLRHEQRPAMLVALPLTGVLDPWAREGRPLPPDRPSQPVLYESQPVILYEQYVPPAPVSVPAAASRPWTPPAGYVTISVPIYRQAMPLDCETGALRMGLATYGHYFSDSQLFAGENPDLRAPIMGPNHTVLQWGDPYTNFVGNVYGSDWVPTGYGVYYPVIVSIARSHGLPNAYGGEGFAPSTVYSALAAGHPVEIWIETNWARPAVGTWTAWDGRAVRYSLIEHAVILSGVSPTMVRVNDPLNGTQYWVSRWTFETVWRDFNDMAVIFQ